MSVKSQVPSMLINVALKSAVRSDVLTILLCHSQRVMDPSYRNDLL